MKLLRLAPENTKFGFMRLRRVSYPLSAFLSIVVGGDVLLRRHEFRHRLCRRHAGRTARQERRRRSRRPPRQGRQPRPRPGRGAALWAPKPTSTLRVKVQPGGEQGEQTAVAKLRQAFGDDYEFRSVDAVGPRVSGELVQSGTLGVVVAILCGADLSVVPLRMAVRGRRDHRHDARSAADGRLLLRSPSSNSTRPRSRRF